MAETLSNNEIALRSCILYETLRGESIAETYKKLQEVINNLDYNEFEYWFIRFSNGKFELDHDRSLDSKPCGLLAMPNEVMEMITKDLSLADRLNTRKVSQRLRAVIDQQKAHCDKLTINAKRNSTYQISMKNQMAIYSSKGFNRCTLDVNRCDPSLPWPNTSEFKKELYVRGGQQEIIRKDLSIIFNPKWTLEELVMDFDSDRRQDDRKVDNGRRLKFIKSVMSASKLSVKKFTLRSFGLAPMIALLPCLDPDVLEKITLECDQINNYMNRAVMRTAHWKNAKSFCFKKIPGWFPIEKLSHAKEFTIYDMKITAARLRIIRDILFKSPTFEACNLYIEHNDHIDVQEQYDIDTYNNLLLNWMANTYLDLGRIIERVMAGYQYHVAGTNDHFEIKIVIGEFVGLEIRRVTNDN